MKLEIRIFLTPDEIANQISGELVTLVAENANEGRETYISLSGGNTPRILFTNLSDNFENSIDWKKLHLFWSDERCVPPDSSESNYGMTKKYLLDNIVIPEENVHRIRGESDPKEEVVRFSGEIYKIVPHKNDLPQFDLIILGLGEDGHTASLFPGKKLESVSNRIAGIAVHPVSGQKRITLTSEVLNNSRQNIFMVTGKEKAEIIYKIMSNQDSQVKYPAAKVKAGGTLKWYLDKEAAIKIKMP